MAAQKIPRPITFFILGFALFQACTSASRIERENYYRANPKSLFNDALQNSQKLNTLEASGYLAVESPQGGFNGTVRVYYQQPDSLLVQIKTGPGISVGYMLVIGQKFLLYNISENTLFRSEGSHVPLEELIGIRLQLPNIFDATLGLPRVYAANMPNGSKGDSLQIEVVKDKIHYSLEIDGDQYFYVADPKEGVFVGYTLVRSGETDSIFCDFKQFRKHRGIKIPRHIQVTRPAQKERVSFFYTRLKINGKLAKNRFNLKVSDKAEIIDLDRTSP